MDHHNHKSTRNLSTVGCSLAVALVSLAAFLQLERETQVWARFWFGGQLVSGLLWATIFGQRSSHPVLIRFLNTSNLFCEGVGLPMYTANIVLYQNAIQGFYKNFFPAFCVLSHLAVAGLMSVAILLSCFSGKLGRKLTGFSAGVALLDNIWILASCHLTGNVTGFIGGCFLLVSTFVLNSDVESKSYLFNNVNLYLAGSAVANAAMGYALILA